MNKPGVAVQSVGIGAIYACFCYLSKDTPSHFNVSAGLRMAALLLTPMRLWPAILLGDMWANAAYAAPRFGVAPYTTTSALIAIFLHPLTAVPGAALAHRLRLNLIAPAPADIWKFVASTSSAAILGALSGLAYVLSCTMPLTAQHIDSWGVFEVYFLGVLLGGITVVPAASWIKSELCTKREGRDFGDRGRLFALLSITAAVLSVSVWATHKYPSPHLLLPLRLAMLAMVLLCTIKQGMRGAALAILLVNVAIDLTPFSPRDPELVRVQEISVLVAFTAMLFGAHGAKQIDRLKTFALREERAVAYARQIAAMPERLRSYQASVFDDIYENLAISEQALRDPNLDREQAQQLWWRVISRTRSDLRARREALRPDLLDEFGLKGAVLGCPVIAALHDAGISVHTYLLDDTSKLSAGTQGAAYQLLHEALAEILQSNATRCVTLRIKTGRLGFGYWVALRIVAGITPDFQSGHANLISRSMALADLAEAFGGKLHRKDIAGRHAVTIWLYDDAIERVLDAPSQSAKVSA